MQGKLRFIYAPMESGKSAVLLMEAHYFEKRNVGILCMKSSIDDRDGTDVIKSRIGIERECLTIYPDYDIYKIVEKIIHEQEKNDDENKLRWILVDESQFLTGYQVEQLRAIVDNFDINVMCYGLRTDFQTHLFEGSKRLFELADDIDEMKISCTCENKAIFNARFNEFGVIVTDGEQVLIGGEDKYKPICSKCYRKEVEKIIPKRNVMY
jgi:thymidine kinase